MIVAAVDLLAQLEHTEHMGGDSHVNKLELETQRALLRHAIRHQVSFRLHDDHWGRTRWALLQLFEEGKASMQVGEKQFHIAELTKGKWATGTHPMALRGGYEYKDFSDKVIFKVETWIT